MTYSYSDYNGCYNIEGDPIGHGVAWPVVCCLEDRYFHHLEVNYHHYKFHLLTTLVPFLIRFYLFSIVLLLVQHLNQKQLSSLFFHTRVQRALIGLGFWVPS